MRFILVAAMILLVGCAGGRVAVLRDGEQVRFDFGWGLRDEAVRVTQISVFEVEGGHRGRTVCELRRRSILVDDSVIMKSWTYGQGVFQLSHRGVWPANTQTEVWRCHLSWESLDTYRLHRGSGGMMRSG